MQMTKNQAAEILAQIVDNAAAQEEKTTVFIDVERQEKKVEIVTFKCGAFKKVFETKSGFAFCSAFILTLSKIKSVETQITII